MKVTIRNVNKEVYTFEVTGEEKVIQLKEMIAKDHKHLPTWQTLIYSGKILENDNQLSTYNIAENGFIVCMVKKPKEESTPAPSTTTSTPQATQPTTTPQPATPAAPTTTPIQPTPTPTATSTPTTTPATAPSPATTTSPQRDTGFVSGSEYEATVKEMESMGFSREDVTRALRAAYNNPERAIDLLLSGAVPAATADDEEDEEIGEQQGEQGTGEPNIFDALRNNPHFPILRETIQRNPSVIPELLQQFSQTNPGLVRQITENPQEFLRLFQEPQQPVSIQVSQEERDAIDRLCQVTGFGQAEVVEAYFACDKDEQLTAAYLFEHAEDQDN